MVCCQLAEDCQCAHLRLFDVSSFCGQLDHRVFDHGRTVSICMHSSHRPGLRKPGDITLAQSSTSFQLLDRPLITH